MKKIHTNRLQRLRLRVRPEGQRQDAHDGRWCSSGISTPPISESGDDKEERSGEADDERSGETEEQCDGDKEEISDDKEEEDEADDEV